MLIISDVFSDLIHDSILFEVILLIFVDPLCFFVAKVKLLEYSSEILLARLVLLSTYELAQSSRTILFNEILEVFLNFII
jgi:hypothetical protein